MSNLAKKAPAEYSLLVMTGGEKGAVYQLVSGRITIGRGSENNISIKDDPKISRNHAILVVTSKGVQISDVSDRNKILVNGQEVTNTTLPPGAVIQLGETRFRFQSAVAESDHTVEMAADSQAGINAIVGGSSLISPSALRAAGGVIAAGAADPNPQPPRKSRRANKQGSGFFYVLVALIAIGGVWLYTSKPSAPIDNNKVADDGSAEITANQKSVEALKAERERAGMNSPQYKDAQQNFVKGFRDYYKGQYERASESFRACLSLFPNHEQCNRYLGLSIKKFNELIQYHMILGGKYKDQNQYRACMAEYQNVTVMVKDHNQKNYQEARSGYEFCEAQAGEKF